MNSVTFVGIDIKVIARETTSRGEVAENWLEVPASIDTADVEEFVVERFGEPLDLEVESRSDQGEVVRGWVFPTVSPGLIAGPAEGIEMIVVPFVRFPDGTRRELFDYMAELDREFRELALGIDPQAHIPGTPASCRPAALLADEHIAVYSTDPDLLTLQIAGWIRRAIREGHTYLVFDLTATGRYVQFVTHDGTPLRGEVSGDRHLSSSQRLSPAEHEALIAAGWSGPESCDEDCGNYWVQWGKPRRTEFADYQVKSRPDEAAQIASATLWSVFGVKDPAEIEVTAGPAWQAGD